MMFNWKIRSFWYVLVIVVVLAIVLWPLARPGFIVTDDGDWMVIRLSAFFQSLREGQFPVRFLGRLNYSYGYPVANFLYPGFLYLGSLIHLAGVSFPDVIKVIFAGSVIFSAFCIFAWLRKHFEAFPSLIGTLNFLFAPYLLFDIYKRGSVGEVLAMVPAAMGFYSIDAKKYWLLPLAIGFLIVSHNSLALLFLVILAAYIVIKGNFFLFIPYLLGVGLATFFWFPALFERRYVMFDQVSISQPAKYFAQGAEVILLGLSSVAAGSLLLVAGNRLRRPQFVFFIIVFVFGILLATPLSSFLWRNAILTNLFQFPYRFLAAGLLAGAWLVAYTLTLYAKHTKKLLILFIILWLVPLVPLLTGVKTVERPIGYYATNEATTTVLDEYMPRWVAHKPVSRARQKIVFYKGRGTINMGKASTQHVKVTVGAEEDSIIQVNMIYYPGWGVTVDDQPSLPTYQNPQGVIRVPIPKGTHRIVAEFRETVPRFVADMVSVGCAILAVIYAAAGARRKFSRL